MNLMIFLLSKKNLKFSKFWKRKSIKLIKYGIFEQKKTLLTKEKKYF